MTTHIYYLEREGMPFYIGKTNKPSNRQNSHRAKRKDFTLNLYILDEVPVNEWKYWESFYISLFKNWGFRLENKNDGGGGMTYQSPLTRIKISNKTKGKPKPPRTEEHCLKLSQSTKGHLMSELTRSKISQSNKGRISPNKGKIGCNKGKVMTDDQKQKISSALKGKPKPDGFLKKSIGQYTIDDKFIAEYSSIGEANKITKIYRTGISLCCNNKKTTSGGFKWKFLN